MKKLFVILSLLAFIACIPVTVHAVEKKHIDTTIVIQKDTIINGIIESIEDSVTQAEAKVIVENFKTAWYAMPVKGSSVWDWIKWIFLFCFLPVGGLLTIIFRVVPTSYKEKYKWLRVLENTVEMLLKIIRLIPNRNKLGGVHKE